MSNRPCSIIQRYREDIVVQSVGAEDGHTTRGSLPMRSTRRDQQSQSLLQVVLGEREAGSENVRESL